MIFFLNVEVYYIALAGHQIMISLLVVLIISVGITSGGPIALLAGGGGCSTTCAAACAPSLVWWPVCYPACVLGCLAGLAVIPA